MAADVRSIDALREWYAALAEYGDMLGESLAGIELEIRRGMEWLAEQLSLWQRAVRDCEEEVVQAKAELASRRFPGFDDRMPDTTLQERNLRRARARLEYAEDQVVKVRSWTGRLPKVVDELYRGPAHRLSGFLEGDLAKGLAMLGRQIAALDSYAGLRPDFAPAPSSATLAPPPPREPASGEAS
ncbi:MAG TPA: hypothetical protein VN641_16825 [Urbifossiella sp.]|nr:hypothetical protein [Urbifossiella sp.]